MGHSQRVYHGFPEFFNNVIETSDIFKRDRDILRSHDVHRDSLLVLCQDQVLFPLLPLLPASLWIFIVVIVWSIESPKDCCRLLPRLLLLLVFGVEFNPREEIPNEEIRRRGLRSILVNSGDFAELPSGYLQSRQPLVALAGSAAIAARLMP